MMSIFHRNPRTTLTIFVALFLSLGLCGLEWTARHVFGLGNVVVYESHPLYGYRPAPSQVAIRLQGKKVGLNNLGLRAEEDWPRTERDGRVLFLGDSITYGGSYVGNAELFSTLSVEALPHLSAGNGGVNGWGVSNVKALVSDTHFTPAQYYISTFAEEDFERGLNRFGGTPYWSKQPNFALIELFYYWLYKINMFKYSNPQVARTLEDYSLAKQQAVVDLKFYDTYLASQGYTHLIYITPTKKQALGKKEKDSELLALFKQAEIAPRYLVDSLDKDEDIVTYYHDAAHLSVEGHLRWAQFYAEDLAKL